MPADKVATLERAIQDYCGSVGLPQDEQFKWSPGETEKFMKNEMNSKDRIEFFINLIGLAKSHGAEAYVVITDTQFNHALKESKDHEHDITSLFLERADWAFHNAKKDGIVLIAAPGGGPKDRNKFVAQCLETIRVGTKYVDFENMALGVLIAPSRQIRLLQLADVLTSCTVARVGGENNFSPRVFSEIKQIFSRQGSRTGGIGLKIHPDFKYVNLYHWLLGDSFYSKGYFGGPLPLKTRPYSESAEEPGLLKM